MPVMPANVQRATLTRIIDGDTIEVSLNGVTESIRLIGLDTPERGQCFTTQATAQVTQIIVGQAAVAGVEVLLEADPSQDDRDRFARLLRFVWLPDARQVNFLMIRDGFGFEYTFRRAYKYQAEFRGAEAYAKQGQLGLWSPTTCNGQTGRSSN